MFGKIIKTKSQFQEVLEKDSSEDSLVMTSAVLLSDVKDELSNVDCIGVPIGSLASLGAGVASLIPAFRTVTQTITFEADGLYMLANAATGDTLKLAKDGNYWGAFKTAAGGSKFAKLKEAGAISSSTKMVMPINPATVLMAAALFSIEQQLGDIQKIGREILDFLQIEKEAEIEADIETLVSILEKYKFNWANEHFIASNHKMVLDIQRTARKNIDAYRKNVLNDLNARKPIISSAQVNVVLRDLLKMFKYYRLSLYTFSLASFLEIMLGGDFKEDSISFATKEITRLTTEYEEIYEKCESYLEDLSSASFETNVMKGVGKASNVVGKVIGSIPVIQRGPVDEFLQDSGDKLNRNAGNIEKKTVESFSSIKNPETSLFVEKMDDIIRIYNRTEKICFDEKKIYLVSRK